MTITEYNDDDESNIHAYLLLDKIIAPNEVKKIIALLEQKHRVATMRNAHRRAEQLDLLIHYFSIYENAQANVMVQQESLVNNIEMLNDLQKKLQALALKTLNADSPQSSQTNSDSFDMLGLVKKVLRTVRGDSEMDTAVSPSTVPTPPSPPLPLHPHLAPIENADPDLTVYCLGKFRVYHKDQQINLPNGIKGQLLKYLITQRGNPISKEQLADLFWPDSTPEATRNSLHQAIFQLRQLLKQYQFGKTTILLKNEQYCFNPDLSIWIDADAFVNHFNLGITNLNKGAKQQAIEQFAIAETLYLGQFMEELSYEEWPIGQRQALHTQFVTATSEMIKHYMEMGTLTAVVNLCHKRLQYENYDEFAHQHLMRCYMAQGQRHMAIQQYQHCAAALDELGLLPSTDTESLYLSIIS